MHFSKLLSFVITLLLCNLKLTNHKSHMSKTVQDIVRYTSYQLEIFSVEFWFLNVCLSLINKSLVAERKLYWGILNTLFATTGN